MGFWGDEFMLLPEWISKLEKKIGWLQVPQLGFILICMQVIGFIIVLKKPVVAELLFLDPSAVLKGEIWRLFTFIAIPLTNDFLMLFLWWFLYYIFKFLRVSWGDFKLTLYFILGWLGTIIGSFVFNVPVDSFMLMLSTYFFAIATLNPEYEVLFFFILRIKMKWIALFSAIVLFLQQAFFGAWQMTLCLLFACVNYILFFGPHFYRFLRSEMKRRRENI
ncbi:MAG TPA: hypothetical protein GX724_01175 [Fibrobacter sp.]|nr:hypothetical protein [Fibrobacter sp.]